MANLFAKLISRIFGPLTVEPLIFVFILLLGTDLPTESQVIVGIILLVTNLVVPGIIMGWAVLTQRISDLDITKREERTLIFTVAMLVGWLGMGVIFLLDLSAPIFGRILFAQTMVLTILWALTFYEKVSLHAAGITNLVLVVLIVFGGQFWPLGFCIPLVCWARWYLKKHTILQLAIGTFVPVVVYGLVFLTLP